MRVSELVTSTQGPTGLLFLLRLSVEAFRIASHGDSLVTEVTSALGTPFQSYQSVSPHCLSTVVTCMCARVGSVAAVRVAGGWPWRSPPLPLALRSPGCQMRTRMSASPRLQDEFYVEY